MNVKILICVFKFPFLKKNLYFISKDIYGAALEKNQGSFYVTTRRSLVPTLGQGYLSDLVMFLEIELPGKKDVSYG